MTRFSADWHARRELEVIESERKLVDKACGVDNMEFVDLGMGTLRIAQPPVLHRAAASSPLAPVSSLSSARSGPTPSERDVLAAVIRALALHPKVAWATRMNVGGMTLDGRHVRFGFKGCSDIIGQVRDGRFLAVECKRPGKHPTDDQLAFLVRVQNAGGIAFTAWSVDDVARGMA